MNVTKPMVLQSALLASILIVHVAAVSDGGVPKDLPGPTYHQILARCQIPDGFSEVRQHLSSSRNLPLLNDGGAGRNSGVLLLIKGEGGLDIVHRIGTNTAWRATESGAQLLDNAVENGPYHLVLNRSSGPEHFLFSVSGNGNGELLWSTVSVTSVTDCRSG